VRRVQPNACAFHVCPLSLLMESKV
jgi:hypothetical protein